MKAIILKSPKWYRETVVLMTSTTEILGTINDRKRSWNITNCCVCNVFHSLLNKNWYGAFDAEYQTKKWISKHMNNYYIIIINNKSTWEIFHIIKYLSILRTRAKKHLTDDRYVDRQLENVSRIIAWKIITNRNISNTLLEGDITCAARSLTAMILLSTVAGRKKKHPILNSQQQPFPEIHTRFLSYDV